MTLLYICTYICTVHGYIEYNNLKKKPFLFVCLLNECIRTFLFQRKSSKNSNYDLFIIGYNLFAYRTFMYIQYLLFTLSLTPSLSLSFLSFLECFVCNLHAITCDIWGHNTYTTMLKNKSKKDNNDIIINNNLM